MRLLVKKQRKITINITSLIDVMFLLLIFFMVSSTFIERPGMKLDLPEAEKHETILVKDLVLQVLSDEKLILNDNDVEIENIEKAFEEAIALNSSTTLILQADQSVSHGLVVHIMDEAKKAGVKKLVIGVSKPQHE